MIETLVRTEGICKSFSSVEVLSNISVSIRAGEILGLVGENGAGKSTFVKILSGIYQPTSGTVEFAGKPVEIRGPIQAKALGIGMIPQEFNLVEHMNVYENVFLGDEIRRPNGLLDRKAMIRRTAGLMAELGVDVDPEASIIGLSVAKKQMVEIAKAIKAESRLLIMDEPSTVLMTHEIDILYRIMRTLKERGTSIVYISHKLQEVKTICDRVMVLRDGQFICLEDTALMATEEIARSMVGRTLSQIFPEKKTGGGGIALELSGVCVPGVLHDIDFRVRHGEILGFSGLIGAGRTELAETVLGIRKMSAGEIRIDGKPVTVRNPRDAVRAGISYVSEDRQGSGIITSFGMDRNVTLVSLEKYANPFINRRKELEKTGFYVKRFNIKTTSLDKLMEQLSGGNQQKVSLAKSLDVDPRILIIDEPTRGIDIKAKSDIYAFIRELADQGMAVIIISSEMEEVMGMCSRVCVMKDGYIAGELSGERINEEEIISLATGIKGVAQ